MKRKRRKRKPEKSRRNKLLKAWSLAVRERDEWVCAFCGEADPRLNAHHILPKDIYPQFMFEVNNGISLCPFKCHKRKAHYNGFVFTLWLKKNRPKQFEFLSNLLEKENLI